MRVVIGMQGDVLASMNSLSPASAAIAEQADVSYISAEQFNDLVTKAADKLA